MCAHSRRFVLTVIAGFLASARGAIAAAPDHALFVRVAFRMKEVAIGNGDQPFGAVVVRNGDVIGYGPSRVIAKNDLNAHAEREAIRDAQVNLGRDDLTDCVLYSTSRACADCESAAAKAHVLRMYFGAEAVDGGIPRVQR